MLPSLVGLDPDEICTLLDLQPRFRGLQPMHWMATRIH